MPLGFLLRAGIWITAAGTALLQPAFLEPLWTIAEGAFRGFARRKILSCTAVALLVLVSRLALLAVWEIPKPFVHDEYGYLLQGDTFASGRLTNPTHPVAESFESPYVLQRPSYNAKFPPGQGLVLALGQMVFGHPWFGVWLSCGLLASVCCWALQGWLDAGWALFGTVLILPLCVLSYWMNSYWGGAAAGIGGALVLGALPRVPSGSVSAGAIFALGATVLALTRPFEGLVVAAPLLLALLFRKPSAPQWAALGATALAGAGFLAYYNFRVTGSPLRMPYFEYEAQYPMTSHFNVLSLPAQRGYREPGIQWVDHWERAAWEHAREPRFLAQRAGDLIARLTTFFGSPFALLPMLAFAAAWWREPKLRGVRWAVGLTVLTAFLEVLYFDHYAAPALGPLLLLVVEGFRHLRGWTLPGGRPMGIWLTRTMPIAALLIAGMDPAAKFVRGAQLYHPAAGGREALERSLDGDFGPHLILVRHTNPASVEPQWALYPKMELAPVPVEFVHNGANIDQQLIVWASESGDEANRRLREYYKDRTVWLYSPEEDPNRLNRLP